MPNHSVNSNKTYKACSLCHGDSTENIKDVTRREEEHVGVALSHAVMRVMGSADRAAARVPATLRHMGEKGLWLRSMQANQSQK